ncbi:hypothetical protein ACFX2B_013834 [Malus domestica]
MPLSELYDPNAGYLVNDTVVVEAEIRLKEEQEEEGKRGDEAKMWLYTIVKVKASVYPRSYHCLFRRVSKDYEKAHSFRIQQKTPFFLFKISNFEMVHRSILQKEFGIPVQFQRFWIWHKRLHCTYRPHRPLTLQEESQSVEQLTAISSESHKNFELNLFLEVEFGPDLHPIPLPEPTKMSFFSLSFMNQRNKDYVLLVGFM